MRFLVIILLLLIVKVNISGDETRSLHRQSNLSLKHPYSVRDLAFSPDGKWMVSSGGVMDKYGEFRVWHTDRYSLLQTLRLGKEPIGTVEFCPNNTLMVAANRRTVTVWSTVTWKIIRTLSQVPHGVIRQICFSPDGKILAVASEPISSASSHSADKNSIYVDLWNIDSGVKIYQLSTPARSISFSPDGRMLAVGWEKISLWDIQQRKHILTVPLPAGNSVTVLAFSPDSKYLANGIRSTKTIQIRRVADAAIVKTLTGHHGYVYNLEFVPDTQMLIGGVASYIPLKDG